MSEQTVTVIEIGSERWPRWLVYSGDRQRYWSKGRWLKRRRDAELWHKKSEAEAARQEAALFSDATGIEDE